MNKLYTYEYKKVKYYYEHADSCFYPELLASSILEDLHILKT